jgi:hypothetical protein
MKHITYFIKVDKLELEGHNILNYLFIDGEWTLLLVMKCFEGLNCLNVFFMKLILVVHVFILVLFFNILLISFLHFFKMKKSDALMSSNFITWSSWIRGFTTLLTPWISNCLRWFKVFICWWMQGISKIIGSKNSIKFVNFPYSQNANNFFIFKF